MNEGEILYQALSAKIGIVVRCGDQLTLARQRLYAARERLKDPTLAGLQIRAGFNGELWILSGGQHEAI